MKKSYMIIFCIVLLIPLAFQGCLPSLYLNKDYQFAQKREFKLAISPVGSRANFSDSIFVDFFSDSTGSYQLLSPAESRHSIINDSLLARVMNNVVSVDHSENDIKANPNLRNLVKDEDITLLRSRFGMSDLLLVPVQFNLSSFLGHTQGRTHFRLYDLNSGQLVYETDRDLNVDRTGEFGEKYLTIALIGFAKDDFEANYLSKLKSTRGN